MQRPRTSWYAWRSRGIGACCWARSHATLIVRSGARLGKSGVLLGRSDGLPIYMSYSAASAAMLGAASAAMVSVRDTTNH